MRWLVCFVKGHRWWYLWEKVPEELGSRNGEWMISMKLDATSKTCVRCGQTRWLTSKERERLRKIKENLSGV